MREGAHATGPERRRRLTVRRARTEPRSRAPSSSRRASVTRSSPAPGGVSRAPWDTLNFAASTGRRSRGRAREPRARRARARGRRGAALLPEPGPRRRRAGCSPATRTATRCSDASATSPLSRAPGVACGVRTADCVPVLVADRASGRRGRDPQRLARHRRRTSPRRASRALRELARRRGRSRRGDRPAHRGAAASRSATTWPPSSRALLDRWATPRSIRAGAQAARRSARASSARSSRRWASRAEAIDDVRGCTVCDARAVPLVPARRRGGRAAALGDRRSFNR